MTGSHQTVAVSLGDRSYEIHVGNGLLRQIGSQLAAIDDISRVIVITDSHVGALYAETVQASLRTAELPFDLLTVKAGEKSKRVETADSLWQQVLSVGADRQAVVVALGGGVVGDLAGFVAATFGRGVRFVQLPTSLLAQVDSSVGGKVGINLADAKNIVGCFWQPVHVSIDLEVLHTLPDNEFAAGMAEVIKYGVIHDAAFFAQLENDIEQIEQRDSATLATIVARCCQIKAEVVAADEREETGVRAILNYGHTFGHALESLTGYSTYLHGEAVAIGMTCAAKLAVKLGMIEPSILDRQTTLLEKANLPTRMPTQDLDDFLTAMGRDKKTVNQQIRLVLPDRLGHVVLRDDVAQSDIRSAIQATFE